MSPVPESYKTRYPGAIIYALPQNFSRGSNTRRAEVKTDALTGKFYPYFYFKTPVFISRCAEAEFYPRFEYFTCVLENFTFVSIRNPSYILEIVRIDCESFVYIRNHSVLKSIFSYRLEITRIDHESYVSIRNLMYRLRIFRIHYFHHVFNILNTYRIFSMCIQYFSYGSVIFDLILKKCIIMLENPGITSK